MTIYVVIYEYYDDWELVGASVDPERAKQLKRDYVDAQARSRARQDEIYKRTEIIECEDGVRL